MTYLLYLIEFGVKKKFKNLNLYEILVIKRRYGIPKKKITPGLRLLLEMHKRY